ncbi:MAG: hypothetical protein Q9177_005751, partial [Variospora cf. flavescens]
YDIRYSVALAAIRGLTNLFRIHGFYEAAVWIHLISVDRESPDGDIVVMGSEEGRESG